MKKDFTEVFTRVEISHEMEHSAPKEYLKNHVDSKLFHGIARYILDNIDNLPVERIESIWGHTGNTEHRVKFNLISDAEYRRLLSIEEELNRLKFGC